MENSRKIFLLEIGKILDEFFCEAEYPAEVVANTNKMIQHIMPNHVEGSTALLFPKFCKILKPDITEEEKRQALLLGWIYQLSCSYYIFRDDYIDDGNSRCGNASWSKLHNHSKLVLLPDLSIIRAFLFFTLRKKFSHLPSIYLQLLHLFLDCDNLMSKGLRLEKHQLIQNVRDGKLKLESFNIQTFKLIFGLQFSVYVYLPFALSMTISGYQIDEHTELYQKVESICNSYGALLKVCDDYYEIFYPSNKIGTDSSDADIRDGQFTWLFLMAKENCKSNDQVDYLLDNYGHDNDESVANIMALLEKIEIHDLFQNYRKQTYSNTVKEIDSCLKENIKVQEMVKWFFDYSMKYYGI